MSQTLNRATSFVLAALVTAATFAGANGLAAQQYAHAAAQATEQIATVQHVVVIGHRAA